MESAGYGHIGGSMSLCDMLAVLYNDIMVVDPKNPKDKDRDYLVLSKGHCGPALYATLAYKGFITKEDLKTLNKGGTKLPSHCDRVKTNGIDISTGSLGQGLSMASGVAMGKRLQGFKGTVYCIVGDGELQEGQNWEAIQHIAHNCLTNVVLIVDNNKRQLDGYVDDICKQFSLKDKFNSFGLEAYEADGHNVKSIYETLIKARNSQKPVAIIMQTEKGFGCNFAEINGFNHYMVFNSEQADSARAEIDRRLRNHLENTRAK